MSKKLENFERAFSNGSASCSLICECGRTFYHDDPIYSWEDGEIEKLRANSNATGIDWSSSEIGFEGKVYAADCDCWHGRARRLMGFLDGHGHKIARYLTLEKARKQSEADHSPIIKE